MKLMDYVFKCFFIHLFFFGLSAHTRTIKGVSIFYQTFITVQDIEGSSKVPAQAVTGDTDLFAITNQFLISESLEPLLQVINLAKCPASISNFHFIGGLIVTYCVVDKFRAAQ